MLAFADRPASEQSWPAQELLTVRRQIRRGRLARGITFVVAVLCIEGVWLPNRTSDNWNSFLVPMMITTVCVAVLLAPTPTARRILSEPMDRIDLSSRSVWTFGRRWWFASWIVAAVLLVTTVLLAGLASSRDDQGRYAVLSVKVGSASGSSTFLGWYYGVPILIGLAVLAAVTVAALWVTARPPLAGTTDGRKADVWVRRLRTRTILSLSGGALILTLSWSLLCIAGGASLTLQFPAGELGTIAVGTPLAAVAIPLHVIGLLLQGIGIALLLLPLLTKLPRTPAREWLGSPAEASTIPISEPQV